MQRPADCLIDWTIDRDTLILKCDMNRVDGSTSTDPENISRFLYTDAAVHRGIN